VKRILLALSLMIVAVHATAGATDARSVNAIADASNRFCLDLYQQVDGRPGNLAFSPYSITSTLAMTYAGARGRTEEEMARVLHLPFGQDGTHAAFASLKAELLASASYSIGMPSAFGPTDADFSGMDDDRDLFLSAVVHKTVVDVAERRAEAAAATAIDLQLGERVVPERRPAFFTADHPVPSILRDDRTGDILFIGRVTNHLL
jgi:serine protease inhibitor